MKRLHESYVTDDPTPVSKRLKDLSELIPRELEEEREALRAERISLRRFKRTLVARMHQLSREITQGNNSSSMGWK